MQGCFIKHSDLNRLVLVFVAICSNSGLNEYFMISEIVNYVTALNDKLQWLEP